MSDLDEILGRTRCARCDAPLDGDIECPYCTGLYSEEGQGGKWGQGGRGDGRKGSGSRGALWWIFLLLCLVTFPLSLPVIIVFVRMELRWKAVLVLFGFLWSIFWASMMGVTRVLW